MNILLALLAMLLVAACGGAPASTGEATGGEGAAPPVSATARIGWGGSPDSLNPGVGVLAEAYTIYGLVYDAMFELQLDGSYTPELAESFTVSDDGLVWTFKIRDDFTFHDGQPLTAEDIAFSYNFYQAHEEFPFLNAYTGYFASVEAPDPSTVVLTLTEAIPNLESQLLYLFVLPKHIWKEHAGEGAADFANDAMIGSGPFKLAEYQQNQFVRLDAVTTHPLYPPKVDGVIFQTFDNQDSLVQALRTGQVDMITEMPATAVASLRNDNNITLVVGPPAAPDIADIIFNQVAPENCPPDDGVCSGHPALRDRAVRLALAHATDKQQIIDVILLGLGNPGLTLVADSLGVWYNDTLADYAFDPALANQILDDAGYLDTNNDGVREMPDGSRDLTFRLAWPSDSTGAPRMAELLNGLWAQVGVKTELQALDPDALTAVCCPAFDYDIILWGWGSDPDPAFLLGVMTTDEIVTGMSETGYSNPVYDDLFAQQAVALDPAQRKEIIWEMQRTVHEDVVYIIPYYASNVQAFRNDGFQGWITDAGKVELSDLSSLHVIEPVQ